ncbi:MAG: HWE histidine kinase domain-containing protein, partial [Novosphingobium sp.]
MEKRYIRPDGSLLWAELSVALLRDCSGKPIHLVSITSDIDQRKQAEVQLVLGEANHRAKNPLTVVGAVVRKRARTVENATDLADKISGCLAGLAASYDLLVGQSVDGGDLEQLIQR